MRSESPGSGNKLTSGGAGIISLIMALRTIITLPDPRLRLKCAPVPVIDNGILALMDDMLETMYAAPGIGLAAVQIAVPKRVLVLDVAKREDENATPDPMCIVNPEILWISEELSTYQEGCLSIPDFFEDVERPARVRARYLDRNGRTQEIEADGILATCLQHEIDHLNGILFIDHLSRLKRDRITRKFAKTAKHRSSPRRKAGTDEKQAAASTPSMDMPIARALMTCSTRRRFDRRRKSLDQAGPLRIVFMGTPDFAVPTLTQIIERVIAWRRSIRGRRRPGGRRGLEPKPSPVHAAALRLGIEVVTPPSLRSEEAAAALRAFKPDVAVVAAYGLILPKAILAVPPQGCLNLHASLLPRWRGAAPIQRAIMAGDLETGVMVMRMEEGLDTGPVALTERIAIGPDANADELIRKTCLRGGRFDGAGFDDAGGWHARLYARKRADGVTYAHKIDKAEARIDWTKPAADIAQSRPGAGASSRARFSKRTSARDWSGSKFCARRSREGAGRPAAFSTRI